MATAVRDPSFILKARLNSVSTGGCIYNADMRARVKYAYDHGHLIGSHTWHHNDLTTLSWDQGQCYHPGCHLLKEDLY